MGVASRAMHAATFAALGEPTRLRIVEFLRGRATSVGDLADALGIRQPQASKHLRVLLDVGLVEVEPVARRRIYALRGDRLDEIATWAASFEAQWESRLDSLESFLSPADTPTAPQPPPTEEPPS